MLTTMGKEEEVESSQPKALFADNLELEAPKDIRLNHKVENNVMSASLSWDSMHQLFDRLVTVVQLYDNEGELYDLPRYLPAGETSITIEHGKPWAVKWGRRYTLTTCVKSATEDTLGDCGEETPQTALFPDNLLKPPKNIRVEHGFDPEQQSAFAVVHWENAIEDEFEGLATLFKSWVPDLKYNEDVEDTSVRRKRQTEEMTSPLPPGHYRPQLFRYSETSKHFYLIDVDQRTLFSLQAVINDSVMVQGDASKPQSLFDESLVKIGPPADVEVQQVVENGSLTSTVRWSPSKIKPPSKLVIYPGEEEGAEPIRTINLDPSQAEMSLDLEASLPADAVFTLASSFKPGHWEEGERQRLFFTFSKDEPSGPVGEIVLNPPVVTTITVLPSSNSSISIARVEWNHTVEEFSLLRTRVSVWRENGSLYEAFTVEGNEKQLEVLVGEAFGARVSLQASVNEYLSDHSPRRLIFSEEEGLSWILLIVGFRMSSSGAAATIGFLSLPMYILVEFLIAVTWFNLEELHMIRKKLHSVSPELLLIITTCAYLFVLEDQASQNYGIAFLLLGRLCICIKSYLNERSALLQSNEDEGTISSATLFLIINTIMMYMSSPPMALLEYGEFDWINLLSLKGWEWLTLLPFCAEFGIHVTNILCETWIGGEMHTIAGMFGRILGMYIAFTYDVVPTHPIVLSVICITLAVIAYIRLHYRVVATEKSVDLIDGYEPFLTTPYWNGKINFVTAVA